MTLGELDNYLNEKMDNNEQFMEFTFFELRIKNNLSKLEANKFIELAKIKLEKNNYNTYEPGDMYIFNNKNCEVKENQLLIAIKKHKEI